MPNQQRWFPGPMSVRVKLVNWIVLVLLQGASALFFIGDVFTEIRYAGLVRHTVLEGMATVALILGVVLGGAEILRLSRQAMRADAHLMRARAEFSDLVQMRFAQWALSPAEAEVALLQLKGFDIAEIAELRDTAQGTVRAQLSHIYEKSGQASRGRFVSSFLDILIETPPRAKGR